MHRTHIPPTGLLLLAGLVFCPYAGAVDAPPTGISRDQATQLLDTLNDPAKRERFTTTLQAYVNALPSTAGAAPSAPPTPPAAAATKKPRGPSALQRAFARVQTAGAQLTLELRSITDLPALSAWLASRMEDPSERDSLYQGVLRIILIFGLTLGADALLRWLIRRRMSAPADRPSQDRHPDAHETLGALMVRFAAIIGAGVVGNTATLAVAELPVARLIAFGVVNTYIALRVMLAFVNAFVRTETPHALELPRGLRLLLISFIVVVALQLLSGDVSGELGAPDSVQEALAKCIALVAHVLAIVIVLAARPMVSGWIRRHSDAKSHWSPITEAIAAIWPTVAVCAIAGSWLVWALDIPDAYREIIRLILGTVAVLFISRFIGNLILRGIDRRMSEFSSRPSESFGARLFAYRNAVRRVVQVLLVVATLLALTESWGLPSLTWLATGHPGHRFAEFAFQLLTLAIIGIACWEAADLAFERRVNSLVEAASISRATRLRTLRPIIRFALLVVIALLVAMTALNAIGINVGPLLAGASIVGVALGFGSQKLVQDFITGIFLLAEDAMDVGDWVTLGGVSGTVEHISIRTIRLRAGDGSTHLVPFSSVTTVNNTNRGLGNAAVTVNVDPSEDTDRVSAILTDIAKEMRQDPAYAAGMQSDLQLWGVDKVDGSMITIVGQIVCTDAARWGVQREFNRRMKLRFSREGVKLAIPQQGLRVEALPETPRERPGEQVLPQVTR